MSTIKVLNSNQYICLLKNIEKVSALNSVILTNDLTKRFGKTIALDELNLKDGGGISGFVGPNGAGKTTTIHILLGFLKPDAGTATVFDLDCWNQSLKIRQKVGFLQEHPTYPSSFTALRFLQHVANLYGLPQPKQKAQKTLKEVGLIDAAEKAIGTYSAGMLQRLGLAQALIGEPELVILDEPTANLDPSGRLDLLEKIKQLHKDQGIRFLISTHILPELEKICNWVSIINEGTIVDQGYIQDLADKYSSNTYRITVSDPPTLLKALQKQTYIEKTWSEENIIYAKVKDINAFREEVPRIATAKKMQLIELRPVYSALEQIYSITMKREEH
jgi:ABC-2 type transport system ATP-binding protein